MSRPFKLLLVALLGLFILACGLISSPLSDVESAASTAQAFASEMPLETVIPMETLEALPSMIPEVGNYFDPTGTPVDEWKGVPVMPQATVGEQFSENTYTYTVPVPATDVQSFYTQKMEELGWTSSFSFPVSEDGGILLFQKDSEIATITIAPDQNDSNSVDVMLNK